MKKPLPNGTKKNFSHAEFIPSDFTAYLNDTKQSKFYRIGLDGIRTLPYIHRWTAAYKNGILRKFYQLNEYYQRFPSPVTMVTFTTYQAGMSKPDQLILLKKSYNKISMVVRKMAKIDYVWILEAHKSGYAHMHCLYFYDFSDIQKDKIRTLWAAGSYEHGVNFEGTIKPSQTLISVTNYLMKYLSKTFNDTSPGQLEFNFNVWAMSRCTDYPGIRLIGSSRDLSKIMKWRKEPVDADKTAYIEIRLSSPHTDVPTLISYNEHMNKFTREYLCTAVQKSISNLNFDIVK